jgi:hypothetical protein
LATTYKILGQSLPTSTNNATLYTVPASKEAICSTLAITNVTGTDASFRVFVVPSAGTASTSNALVYDATITANSYAAFSLGITLATGDSLVVRSGTGSAVCFNAFGTELD